MGYSADPLIRNILNCVWRSTGQSQFPFYPAQFSRLICRRRMKNKTGVLCRVCYMLIIDHEVIRYRFKGYTTRKTIHW